LVPQFSAPRYFTAIYLGQSEPFAQGPLAGKAGEHEREEKRAVPQLVSDELRFSGAACRESLAQAIELVEAEGFPAAGAADPVEQPRIAGNVAHLRLVSFAYVQRDVHRHGFVVVADAPNPQLVV